MEETRPNNSVAVKEDTNAITPEFLLKNGFEMSAIGEMQYYQKKKEDKYSIEVWKYDYLNRWGCEISSYKAVGSPRNVGQTAFFSGNVKSRNDLLIALTLCEVNVEIKL